jgi:ankyrin repeat protein
MTDIHKFRFVHGNEFHNACAMNDLNSVNNIICNPYLNINMKNEEGYTAVMLTCKYNMYKILKLLININNIDFNICDNEGYNCFHIACKYGSVECAKMLINNNKVDINHTVNSINGFTIACINNRYDLVKELAKIANLILQGPHIQYSSLHRMIKRDNYEMVKILLNITRIDPYLKDENNMTPYELITTNNKIKILFDNLKKIPNMKEIFNSTHECTICYDPIIHGYSLNCDERHVYCKNCISNWMECNNTCPMCRKFI